MAIPQRTRPVPPPLARDLRAELRRRANPVKARPMQAYMKSAMPYYGIQTPELRAVCREVFGRNPLPDARAWQETVLFLWRTASRREERYAAIALTGSPLYARFRNFGTLPIYEEMIVDGAWWDYVDGIASDRLGELLARYPATMKRTMRRWSRDPVLWKRRSAILCQLGFKEKTDLSLLYDCIEPNLDDKEFFIRKAIGWALRQYAWTDPSEVLRYVKRAGDRLSPLSRREALKNIGREGRRKGGPPPGRPGSAPTDEPRSRAVRREVPVRGHPGGGGERHRPSACAAGSFGDPGVGIAVPEVPEIRGCIVRPEGLGFWPQA